MIGDIPMRRFEAEIRDKKIIDEIISNIDYVSVGINTSDYPYVVPMNFGYEVTDEKLIVYLHCAKEGYKVDLWTQDPRVSLTFAMFTNHPKQLYRGTMHDFRCVMANGIIRHIVRGKDKGHGRAVQAILAHNDRRPNQFSVPHYMFMDVYVVECDWSHVTAKSECPVHSPEEVPFVSEEILAQNVTTPYDEAYFFNLKRYNASAEIVIPDSSLFERPDINYATDLTGMNCRFRLEWKPKAGFEDIDCDFSALLLDEEGDIPRRYNIAFYNQHTDMHKFVVHEGDDILLKRFVEEIVVDLAIVPEFCRKISFIVSVYDGFDRQQDLSCIESMVLTVLNDDTGDIISIQNIECIDAVARSVFEVAIHEDGTSNIICNNPRSFDSTDFTLIFRELGLTRWKE